jgi:hypothetical protein
MKVTVMTDAKLKEMIASIQRASTTVTSDGLRMVIDKSLGDENEAEGMGQGGADEGDSEGKGAAQRAKIDYLLAEPRLAEAPDDNSSTVVQCTGQDCSPTGPRAVVNPPYTQHRGRDSINKDEGAGLDGNMTEDEPTGLGGKIKDQGAGPDGNMIEDEPAGLNGNMTED